MMIRISHFNSPHEGKKKEKNQLISDDSTPENNHTSSSKTIFLLRVEAGESVWMVMWLSFDLTVSRGLS